MIVSVGFEEETGSTLITGFHYNKSGVLQRDMARSGILPFTGSAAAAILRP